MDIQRVRNLTTDLLHTKIEHVYEDIEYIVGEKGIMTHMLPNANKALKKFLESRLNDPKFWDGKFDVNHVGEVDMKPLTEEEKKEFWDIYASYPHPFQRKNVVVAVID